jgi:superfamily II DNA or RNA helicase
MATGSGKTVVMSMLIAWCSTSVVTHRTNEDQEEAQRTGPELRPDPVVVQGLKPLPNSMT